MGRVEVIEDWRQEISSRQCRQLEAGGILLFPDMDLGLSEYDRRFLLRWRQKEALFHKNIAYRPARDTLKGVARGAGREALRRILRGYSQGAARALERLLPRYVESYRLDFTSFRPFEEAGRALPPHSRNDLLHVDAFPTRPTNGERILRLFTNLNSDEPRVWLTTEAFPALVESLVGRAGLVDEARRRSSPFRQTVARLGRWAGLGSLAGSPYDALMHRFHNFLKESREFQETCPRERVEFPPRSSWMVFTDMLGHAALSGRFALEQTFIVSRRAMLEPQLAPVSVLERLVSMPLTWSV